MHYIVKTGLENQLKGYNSSNLISLIRKHYLYALFLQKDWDEINSNYFSLNVIGTEDTIKDLLNDIGNYLIL